MDNFSRDLSAISDTVSRTDERTKLIVQKLDEQGDRLENLAGELASHGIRLVVLEQKDWDRATTRIDRNTSRLTDLEGRQERSEGRQQSWSSNAGKIAGWAFSGLQTIAIAYLMFKLGIRP